MHKFIRQATGQEQESIWISVVGFIGILAFVALIYLFGIAGGVQ